MALLDTAEVRQQSDHDCGAAAFRILFRFHFPNRKVPDWGALADPVRGVGPDAMELFVRKEFGSVLVGHIDLPHLKFLSARTPVLCIVTVGPVEDHWVVVRGVTPHRVHVQDPSAGRASFTHEDWLARWTDCTAGGGYARFALTGWPA